MLRRIPGWLGVSMAASAVVVAAGQNALQTDQGEQILNGRCSTSCHDLRPIEVQALDVDGWTKTVNAMIEKGAEVKPDDKPVLIDYLVKRHGPLPDGTGKDILLNTCTACHDLQRVRRHGASREKWQETLIVMLNEGAALSEQDFPVLLGYLARNFGPK